MNSLREYIRKKEEDEKECVTEYTIIKL